MKDPPLQLDLRPARFLILRQKFLELLCLREGILVEDPDTHGNFVQSGCDPAIDQVFYSLFYFTLFILPLNLNVDCFDFYHS